MTSGVTSMSTLDNPYRDHVSTLSLPSEFTVGNYSDIDLDLDSDLISPSQYFTLVKGIVALRVFICLGGIVGNIINIRAFLRIGLEDSVTITFFSLAVSDLLLIISVLAASLATLCETFETDFNVVFPLQSFYMKQIFLVSGRPFNYIATLLTMFLAIQRCLCVVIPLQFKGVFTQGRTFVIMFILWIYGIACGIMILSQYQFKKQFVPATNTSIIVRIRKPGIHDITSYLYIANGTVLTFSSQILVMICVLIMAYVLKRSVKFRQMTSSSGAASQKQIRDGDENKPKETDGSSKVTMSNSKERQVIVQVSLVSAIFLAASSPYTMLSITRYFVPDLGVYKRYHYTYATLYDIKVTLEIVNATVNLFVYYKYNTRFRQVCFRKNPN